MNSFGAWLKCILLIALICFRAYFEQVFQSNKLQYMMGFSLVIVGFNLLIGLAFGLIIKVDGHHFSEYLVLSVAMFLICTLPYLGLVVRWLPHAVYTLLMVSEISTVLFGTCLMLSLKAKLTKHQPV